MEPPSGVPVDGQPISALIEAATKAFGASDLRGNEPHVVSARHVAVALAREAGFHADQISAATGASMRTVRRLSAAQCPEPDLRAARRALAIAVALQRQRSRSR